MHQLVKTAPASLFPHGPLNLLVGGFALVLNRGEMTKAASRFQCGRKLKQILSNLEFLVKEFTLSF